MFDKIKQILRVGKGILETDKDGFALWSSYNQKVLIEAEGFNFQQDVFKQNYTNTMDKIKRGLGFVSDSVRGVF